MTDIISKKMDPPTAAVNHRQHAEELKIALENRVFEIQMFWQRSNYFLVLITALGIGTFSIDQKSIAPLVSIAATISSYFWFRTNLGARFWQESWEAEVTMLAKENGIRSFERSLDDIRENVKAELGSETGKTLLRKWVDKKILEKPSVSYQMIQLSIASIFLWSVVTLILIFQVKSEIYLVMKGWQDWMIGLTS